MTSAGKGPESKFGWGELPLFFSQGSSPAIKSLLVLVYSFFFFYFPPSLALEQMSVPRWIPKCAHTGTAGLSGQSSSVNFNFHSSIPGSESLGDVG